MKYGFKIIKREHIAELKAAAVLYRHVKSGAELLSISNEDTNKVFGITFRTPPSDSTGIAHILEHSVLCGSKKYPLKEPFIELIKGSLQTFLNAFTYPDRTCYPVASQNTADLYNLIDVYLDAVFFPLLGPEVLEQEGWHYELETPDGGLSFKGVVFNEMKGAYSSPDGLLERIALQSLFPDTAYGLDSGGDPASIPDLTFEQFSDFHRRMYQPANSRIYFYGDDDPEERLRFMGAYLDCFEARDPDSHINVQAKWPAPRTLRAPFPGDGPRTGMLTMSWLLGDVLNTEESLALCVLDYALLGMPGSPLRKALIESGLGEGLCGGGLETELRQMSFSTGLKGIDPRDAARVETLIMDTLAMLAHDGVDAATLTAALNTIEFRLRENNTGSFPRGLSLMLRALSVWLYGGDPFSMLGFEKRLARVRERFSTDSAFAQTLIRESFLENQHRLSVIMEPDPGMARRLQDEESARLQQAAASLSAQDRKNLAERTRALSERQQQPDTAEALAALPRLRLEDLPRENRIIPCEHMRIADTAVLLHDLFTSGILYCDVGLNLRLLPQKYLPFVPLFSRALLETGAGEQDFVALSQRISTHTGGIRPATFTSAVHRSPTGAAWLFVRAKALASRSADLFSILGDVLTSARFDQKERIRQIILEEKAAFEQRLIPAGHSFVASRLRSHFSEADWAAEQMGGVTYYRFMRDLAQHIDSGWPDILKTLEHMRELLLNREHMLVNATIDAKAFGTVQRELGCFLDTLPRRSVHTPVWQPESRIPAEALLAPSQVNFVGKAFNLYDAGYQYHGSINVITGLLRTMYLWEKVRVQGGAYGAMCGFDRLSGAFWFGSYRDPNLLSTLEVYDRVADWLASVVIEKEELARSIIGTIGEFDSYMLPDMQGYVSLQRHLINMSEDMRAQTRADVFATGIEDVRTAAQAFAALKTSPIIKALAGPDAVAAAGPGGAVFSQTVAVLE
ncbi:MAG: peptidase M16 [Deltaproteobacteria bacterium]|nr:peptidase M16 [Deltaproteobacteria bacterium]